MLHDFHLENHISHFKHGLELLGYVYLNKGTPGVDGGLPISIHTDIFV